MDLTEQPRVLVPDDPTTTLSAPRPARADHRSRSRSGGFGPRLLRLLPGVLGSGVVALGCTVAVQAPFVPAAAASPLLLAIVLGAVVVTMAGLVRGSAHLRAARVWDDARPGVAWTAKHVLRAGVVLLGLRLSVPEVLDLGWSGLTTVVVTLGVTFAATALVGRWMRLPRVMTLLVATGFSVCGAAAVSTMASVVPVDARGHGDDGDERTTPHELDAAVATSIALVTALGLLAVVAGPAIARAVRMDDAQAGLWIGASFPEVAHVAAGAGTISAAALSVATVAKLARVALLAPVVAGVSALARRRGQGRSTTASAAQGARRGYGRRGRRAPAVPLFVLGFACCVVVRSLGVLPGSVLDLANTVSTFFLVMAMFAMGLGVSLPQLVRTARGPLVLGAVAMLVVAVTAGALVLLVG